MSVITANACKKFGDAFQMRTDLSRLCKGFVRRLTSSEVNRGYIYLSRHNEIREILSVDNFEVKILENLLASRKIDKHGRFQVPCKILRKLGTNQLLLFELVSTNKLEIAPFPDGKEPETD